MITADVYLHGPSCEKCYGLLLRWISLCVFGSHKTVAQISCFRSFDGGISKDSLYLAIVRRATLISWSASMLAILLSLKGLLGFSSETSFLMRARIAVEETSPPACVLT